MKTKLTTKLLSLLLVALMLLSTMLASVPVFAEDEELAEYVLDAGTLPLLSSGSRKEGDTDTAGTKNFFTIHYASNTYIDANKKTFEDGTYVTQRLNMQGKTIFDTKVSGAVSFTTQGPATIKVWWICGGDGREMTLFNSAGTAISKTNENPTKNSLYISEFTTTDAGTYYLGNTEGSNIFYKISVTTQKMDFGPRDDWSTVSAPEIRKVETTPEGKIAVTLYAVIDHHAADFVTLDLCHNGEIISSVTSSSIRDKDEYIHVLEFSPIESDIYEIVATLGREDEATVKVTDKYVYDYMVPLAAPYVTNVTNLGNGEVLVVWNEVRFATGYKVVVNGGEPMDISSREITLSGLNIGKNTIQITAYDPDRTTAADPVTFDVTENAEIGWNFTIYGPSTSPSDNSYKENEDGSITITATNNGGKLQPEGPDGLGFYYTAIPSDKNFTLRVNAHVDSWVLTNAQEGFGIMATDHVPSADDYSEKDFWTNMYQVGSTKIEYRYESTDEGDPILYTAASGEGTKYSMKLGIGTISKIGIDQSILDRYALGEDGIIVGPNGNLKSTVQALDWTASIYASKDVQNSQNIYNVIGNYLGDKPQGTLDDRFLVTDLVLEIQKNNTGYFTTYYVKDKNGDLVPMRQIKNYEHDALEQFDSEYVYVGLFAARYATITFSDIELTIIDEKDDKPAEERPIEYIKPTITVTSSNAIASEMYELVADANVDGVIEVRVNNNVVLADQPIKKYERLTKTLDLSEYLRLGENDLIVKFTADENQDMEPYTALSTLKADPHEDILTFFKGAYHTKSIYVSPTGVYNGNGTKENPYDIYTAINRVIPGQTIVLMEGTYKLKTGLRIQRGMNGTEEEPIRMIADPDAKTRPVLDFVNQGTGITHGGNWWYFYGFDVTNTFDSYKGFQVSGSNNVLDNIHTYHNGNTGIQISRYHSADLYKEQWPANNLILNCVSYGNADKGFEDADGFAAKLTIGDGNVFDGCIAYNNADDGWDLYAKIATGPIGTVVIKNCIAYGNGYLEDGTLAGNGNGFKLGGDGLSGGHQLINCIAFNNKQKGIDSNSCPDIVVENCISYNNCSYNVALYTKSSVSNTDFRATGIISFKDDNAKIVHADYIKDKLSEEGIIVDALIGENLKGVGTQDDSKYIGSTNYYWYGMSSVNTDGKFVTADMFVSLEFTGYTRNEDGSIDLHGFLELKDSAPANAGTTDDFTPSAIPTLVPDIEHTYDGTWTSNDPYVHWQECECGFRANVSDHLYKYVVDKEPTQTSPGYKHNECVLCGYKKAQIEIPALGGGSSNTDTNNQGGILGFFAMIWTLIVNFFKSIFGK